MEEESEDYDDTSSTIFSQLKHHCVQLLELLHKPNKNTTAPSQLLQLLRQSPPYALQPFFDYALFPLLLLLDAAIECRSVSRNDKERSARTDTISVLPKVGDSLAEDVVNCLEELLRKCPLGSVDQMIVMLNKLTRGAMLSPSEASEELRGGVIRCFRMLLLSLHPCCDESCSCKRVDGSPGLEDGNDIKAPFTKGFDSVPGQCLITFLRSKSASAAIGHWLSLLLQVADVEAARGHRGSAALRIEAFKTLRVLIDKVGDADSLAFFLPGVVSRIGKVLHTSKSMISGAAGSTETLHLAVRCLAEFLTTVLGDECNAPALNEFQDDVSVLQSSNQNSLNSYLAELRQLPLKYHDQDHQLLDTSSDSSLSVNPVSDYKEDRVVDPDVKGRKLQVNRTKDWVLNSSIQINKLLSATFPQLCIHPSKMVRQGVLAAIQAMLLKCFNSLKESQSLLLECLCLLVSDDSEEVSSAARAFFRYLLTSNRKCQMEHAIEIIFGRFIEKLPQMVLGNEEILSVSHARKLLVVIFFTGPQFVADIFRQSPVIAAQFLDAFALCLSQNSVFAGSLDKLVLAKPSGYMHSIAEMKSKYLVDSNADQNNKIPYQTMTTYKAHELPRMPPWFVNIGSERLYQALSGVLRLVGMALFTGCRGEESLSVVLGIPLSYLRRLISEVRAMEYSMEGWESWYSRSVSGQLVRQASTAACILNEMIFGLSDLSSSIFSGMFGDYDSRWEEIVGHGASVRDRPQDLKQMGAISWRIVWDTAARSRLIDCIGLILHEYLSPEIWNLPVESAASGQQATGGGGSLSFYFFRDNAMLQQVVIEGIGCFAMCLGKDFSFSGFLHSSLFMLLENLICSNYGVRKASDDVLHIIASALNYPTVGDLVIANSDYVIDSICRQLRHLDINPHIPNVLAVILSYIGIGHDILPLLEEPMRAVSVELEILGRYQHAGLTIPFLKAVVEISKASKHEACSLPSRAKSFHEDVKSKVVDVENQIGKDSSFSLSTVQIESFESIMFALSDSRRYRQIVGSLAGSCLTAATPLLASSKQAAALAALEVIEVGMVALAKVEEAYKLEKETKDLLDQAFSTFMLHNLQDSLDASQDEATENRMLPAMTKIWPFLVACMRNRNPAAVRRCCQTISNVVQICGGDFFTRRFQVDGTHFWKILSTSPFQRKPLIKDESTSLLKLPYRKAVQSPEDGVAEVSNLKDQAAVLEMIASLSQNKRSASALETVLKKVSGLVVGIACSGVTGLRRAATKALIGLASMDSDLIWLLLADVYFSMKKTKKKDLPLPPTEECPNVWEIIPPPSSSKGYLHVLYGGQSYGFDIDFSAVEHVFTTLFP